MRIISGKFKGHQLISFQASHIRPTTDRVKESLFNILRDFIENSKILDLFSGTGNLGIESISRDAKEVFFVELNKKSIEIIKRNFDKLKITSNFKLIPSDALKFLEKYNDEPFDIIFADPPFTEEMADEVMEIASKSKAFGDHTIMAIESAKREKIQDTYSNNVVLKDRRFFGDKVLSFYHKKSLT